MRQTYVGRRRLPKKTHPQMAQKEWTAKPPTIVEACLGPVSGIGRWPTYQWRMSPAGTSAQWDPTMTTANGESRRGSARRLRGRSEELGERRLDPRGSRADPKTERADQPYPMNL